jgi:hypothetical protein
MTNEPNRCVSIRPRNCPTASRTDARSRSVSRWMVANTEQMAHLGLSIAPAPGTAPTDPAPAYHPALVEDPARPEK